MKIHHLLILVTIILAGCNKYDAENWRTLKDLYKVYENGEISECKYEGETVYKCVYNSNDDSGTKIYDKDGDLIGTCNIWVAPVASICNETQDCEVVYRINDNIWEQPSIDKYGLGN